MKPHIHAENSAKQFGGKAKDYIEIHRFLDSSKGVIADHRHRALTHNAWFISVVLERVFGYSIINSDKTEVSVRDIGEQHVLEDFRGKFIPSAQDWLEEIEYKDWMANGGTREEKPRAKAKTKANKEEPTYDDSKDTLLEELRRTKQPQFPTNYPNPFGQHGQMID